MNDRQRRLRAILRANPTMVIALLEHRHSCGECECEVCATAYEISREIAFDESAADK